MILTINLTKYFSLTRFIPYQILSKIAYNTVYKSRIDIELIYFDFKVLVHYQIVTHWDKMQLNHAGIQMVITKSSGSAEKAVRK